MRQISGNIFCPDGQFRPGTIEIQEDVITEIQFDDSVPNEVLIIPGLVDIHSHGCIGHDTCDASPKELFEMLEYEKSCGVTSYCPTTMTYGKERIKSIIENVKSCGHSNIKGIYMEGPFISKEKKGAQNEEYIAEPNIQMLEDLITEAEGLVKVVAVAPEVDGAMDMISSLCSKVQFSLAHTCADYDTAILAFKAGAKQVTHLYNAMPSYTHRNPGVVGGAFDTDDVYCELICDGIHVHDAVIRNTFRQLKDDRIILISDSMEATGMPDGQYALGGQAVFKNGRYAKLKDGTLAGSASTLMDCLRHAISIGVPRASAIFSATRNPAMAINIFDSVGSIQVGKKADLLLLNEKYDLLEVIQGEV